MYAEISARIELLAKINVQLFYASVNEKNEAKQKLVWTKLVCHPSDRIGFCNKSTENCNFFLAKVGAAKVVHPYKISEKLERKETQSSHVYGIVKNCNEGCLDKGQNQLISVNISHSDLFAVLQGLINSKGNSWLKEGCVLAKVGGQNGDK